LGAARWSHTEISASEFPVPTDGYEDLALEPEPPAPSPWPPAHPAPAAAELPALHRHPSESSLAAARMANLPTFKAASTRGGVPIVPIVVGLVLIIAITAVALTRGRPASPPVAATSAAEPQVTTIGRPPEPLAAPLAEPEIVPPVVTIDRPADGAMAPRERRKVAEREAPARQPRAAPPVREVARNDRASATARPAPEPAQVPAPVPPPRVEPDPPLPPPPQFVATPAPPTASVPLAIGPSSGREGMQKARQASAGCVVNSLRLPRDIIDVAGESAVVKFAVNDTGQVSQFSYLSGPTDPRVSSQIWAAVQRCDWVPGINVQGRPITLWVTMPIKFGK
jgi:hypothetical protein